MKELLSNIYALGTNKSKYIRIFIVIIQLFHKVSPYDTDFIENYWGNIHPTVIRIHSSTHSTRNI